MSLLNDTEAAILERSKEIQELAEAIHRMEAYGTHLITKEQAIAILRAAARELARMESEP